jgi:hypothetical protein
MYAYCPNALRMSDEAEFDVAQPPWILEYHNSFE